MAPAYSSPSHADNSKEAFSDTSYNSRWPVIVASVVGSVALASILVWISRCILLCSRERNLRRRNHTAHSDLENRESSPAGAISRNIQQEESPSIISRTKDRVDSWRRSESDVPAPANHRIQEPPTPILKKPTESSPDESSPNEHRNVSLSTIFSSLFHTVRSRKDSSTDYTKSDSESDEKSIKSSSSSIVEQPTVPPTSERLYGLFPHFYMRKSKDTPGGGEIKPQSEPVCPRTIQFPGGTTAPTSPLHETPPRTSISSLFRNASKMEDPKGKIPVDSFPTSHKPNPPASLNHRPSTEGSRHSFLPSVLNRRKQNSSGTQDLESFRPSSPTTIQLQTPPATPDLLPDQSHQSSFFSSILKFFEAYVYRKGKVEPAQAEQSFWVERAPPNSGSWIQRQEQIRHTPADDGLRKVSISPLSN